MSTLRWVRGLGLVLALLLTAGAAAADTATQTDADRPAEAAIWYLGHCGYAVRTANHLLIFDYIELEESPTERGLDRGFIDPAEIADQNVVVFVTHSHIDHYDETILGWQETIPDLRYCFGWQFGDGPRFHSLPAPRAALDLPGVKIRTVNSHHSGVAEAAFLVQVDGLTIFHAGDYQGRMSSAREDNVEADMAYLLTETDGVDLLFVGAWVGDPNLKILRGLPCRAAFPMHWRKQETRYRDFTADLAGLGIDTPVACPTRRGDRFLYRDGVVVPAP